MPPSPAWTHCFNLARESVYSCPPYEPGKSIAELQRLHPGLRIIKLASNENPLGPGPLARQALGRITQVSRYPDPTGYELKRALSRHLAVAPQQIILGNGSAEVLAHLAQAFLTADDEVVIPHFAYSLFQLLTRMAGAKCIGVPARAWFPDLAAMANAVTARTKLVILANPNNPTGTWVNQPSLEDFMAKVPARVLVVVDEAYHEYMNIADAPDTLGLQRRHPNLVITRTFSKAYGLAGLRLGYGIANGEIAALLDRVRLTFNINAIAYAVGLAALEDQDHVKRTAEHNARERSKLQERLAELNIPHIPSMTNFLAIDLGRPAAPVFNQLLQRGIITRPLANYDMPNHLRVTLGSRMENEAFLRAFEDLMKNRSGSGTGG